jgi:TolB-like protein/DNA-binding winged helix-turn-helix (wHTH) protein/predicted Zn-dependent protease
MSPDQPPSNAAPVRLSTATDFTLGGLRIRPSACEAIRDGERHHVEPRVMQVLVALVRAEGAVVSRDDLMQSCWDARVVGEAAIHRCICKLRELADAGADRTDFQIETIARIGYRIEPIGARENPVDMATPAVVIHARRPQVRYALVATTCLALAVIALIAWQSRVSASFASTKSAPSIAVMPFQNLSADQDAAYFAAGTRDAVLTRLARFGALRVISRTSADRMAERPGSLKDIAQQLGVAHIVEGSVQRVGNTVRVNVQLIRIAAEDHRWAESYDRPLDDVLSAENDIADAIATALTATIAPGEGEALTKQSPPDRRAYELYLQGVVLFGQIGLGDYNAAAGVLREAVAKDPSFAMAWALLSRTNAQLYFGGGGSEAQRSEARSALDKALALDPSLLEVRLADAFYKYHVEQDFRGAGRAFEALKAKWPNNVEVLRSYGFVMRRLQRWQDSIDALREVVRLDPLVPTNYDVLADTLMMHHERPAALEVLDAGLALWPGDTLLLTRKIDDLQDSGQLDRAEAELARLHPATLNSCVLSVRRTQYTQKRQFAEGLRYFESVRALPEVADWDPVQTAVFDTILGDFRRQTGDEDGARSEYEAALQALRAPLEAMPDDPELLSMVSIAYSGLGDKESALRYATHASRWFVDDPIGAADYERYRATALARLGDADDAIPELARLLEAPGSGLTVDNLRLDPDFDRLRDDRRFARLVAKDHEMNE